MAQGGLLGALARVLESWIIFQTIAFTLKCLCANIEVYQMKYNTNTILYKTNTAIVLQVF